MSTGNLSYSENFARVIRKLSYFSDPLGKQLAKTV